MKYIFIMIGELLYLIILDILTISHKPAIYEMELVQKDYRRNSAEATELEKFFLKIPSCPSLLRC